MRIHTVFPHIVSAETILFVNFEIQRSQYINVRKLFKGGNYMYEEIQFNFEIRIVKDTLPEDLDDGPLLRDVKGGVPTLPSVDEAELVDSVLTC